MAEVTEKKDVNHIHPLPDFVKGGIDYLPPEIFENKDNIQKVLEIFLKRLELIDQKAVELAEMRTIINAEGDTLDEIGRQNGIFRNGLNDPEYRAVIIILTGIGSKSGTRSEIISTLKQLFGEEGVTTYKGRNYRMDINIFNTCVEVELILDQILDMLPLVTHLRVVENQGYPFGFEGDEQAFGWASVYDTDRTGAGGLATLVYVSDDEDPWGF
ncbi:hypothetical protein A71_128 [Escherichia phage A7_1]|uniref:Uncharacterized protein n=2 Tax=Vequintavirinae TaxID=1911928 RepID=A0AAF0AQI1_9CAUD|nr:hypothetical protein A71_128 [Escherichia phage A7_1]UZZ64206.1 hypothetical protein A54_242 [Escherichia phage A5-4]WBF77563.1 hypothetical protein A73_127 [Escherichia phage A73]WBF77827.1 hypothetical protein W70_113 [Escherichia phage W70]